MPIYIHSMDKLLHHLRWFEMFKPQSTFICTSFGDMVNPEFWTISKSIFSSDTSRTKDTKVKSTSELCPFKGSQNFRELKSSEVGKLIQGLANHVWPNDVALWGNAMEGPLEAYAFSVCLK